MSGNSSSLTTCKDKDKIATAGDDTLERKRKSSTPQDKDHGKPAKRARPLESTSKTDNEKSYQQTLPQELTIETLQPDMLFRIADGLDMVSAAILSISSRTLYGKLGSQYSQVFAKLPGLICRPSYNALNIGRKDFLIRLSKDLAGTFCFFCDVLHLPQQSCSCLQCGRHHVVYREGVYPAVTGPGHQPKLARAKRPPDQVRSEDCCSCYSGQYKNMVAIECKHVDAVKIRNAEIGTLPMGSVLSGVGEAYWAREKTIMYKQGKSICVSRVLPDGLGLTCYCQGVITCRLESEIKSGGNKIYKESVW